MIPRTHPMMQQVDARELETRLGFAGHDHARRPPAGAETERRLAEARVQEGFRRAASGARVLLPALRSLFGRVPRRF